MRKMLILPVLILTAVFTAACSGQGDKEDKAGIPAGLEADSRVDRAGEEAAGTVNPYYEEVNRVIYSEFNSPLGNIPEPINEAFEFRLGDTPDGIRKTYGSLKLREETDLLDPFTEKPVPGAQERSRIFDSRKVFAVEKETEAGDYRTILSLAAETGAAGETGADGQPLTMVEVNPDEMSLSSIRLPSSIADMINDHKEEGSWNYYNPETLCFSSIQSKETAPGYHTVNAAFVVFKDRDFSQYLEYRMECLCNTLFDETAAEVKEMMEDRLDELSDWQKADIGQKERLIVSHLTLKAVTPEQGHGDGDRDYADQVLEFVKSGRNQDYFLTKGNVTHTLLEPYGDFLKGQPEGLESLLKPEAAVLGAYGDSALVDTFRDVLGTDVLGTDVLGMDALGTDALEMDLLEPGGLEVLSVANFTDREVDVKDALITRIRYYGGAGNHEYVTVPEQVGDALKQHWLAWMADGAVYSEYDYGNERITVASSGLSQDGRFCSFQVDVIPSDYPRITVRYDVAGSRYGAGLIMDGDFGLAGYD